MAKFRVVFIEHGYPTTLHERSVIEGAGGEFIDANDLPVEEALKRCEEAEGIMLRRMTITAEMIARFRRCKIICRCGVGTDSVDARAATDANIIVGHVPTYGTDEVSTHAIALWLACVRRVVSTHEQMTAGKWDVHGADPLFRTAGKTFGIVGLGNIGRAVAQKLAGWNLRIVATDPFVEPDHAAALGVTLVDLETLCRESDYISLHCPLLPETKHLFNARTLASLKPRAILVNTARGPVIDAAALLAALHAKPDLQAALDVFEEEPPAAESPLRTHPRITVSDHTAWYSEESQMDLQRMAAVEVARVCTGGLPRSLANPEVLKKLGRFEEWEPADNMRWQLRRLFEK
jgi:D-3-phosphoglycerate dehydrogenase / 2-oxoglutarate reductase